jgi:acyl carrier protein
MRERIKAIIKRTFDLPEVADDVSTMNCDKWDSLHHLKLIVELETEFDVSIEPEDIAEMRSLEDIERILHILLNL